MSERLIDDRFRDALQVVAGTMDAFLWAEKYAIAPDASEKARMDVENAIAYGHRLRHHFKLKAVTHVADTIQNALAWKAPKPKAKTPRPT